MVDLLAVRRSCLPLLRWYEGFLVGGRMELRELDHALDTLRRLPPMDGRLGQALRLILSGGAGSSTEETVAAIEQLRRVVAPHLGPESHPPPRRPDRPRRSRDRFQQLAFPGNSPCP